MRFEKSGMIARSLTADGAVVFSALTPGAAQAQDSNQTKTNTQ